MVFQEMKKRYGFTLWLMAIQYGGNPQQMLYVVIEMQFQRQHPPEKRFAAHGASAQIVLFSHPFHLEWMPHPCSRIFVRVP
jgi:hypothetical protein